MNTLKTIIAIALLLAGTGLIAYYFASPAVTENIMRAEAAEAGMDLLKLHEQYPDVIGWIKVEGTNIDYPVMRGEKYLYRTMKDEYDVSGTPFVEEDWSSADRCTIIHGHNMWMYRTMFNALHRFEKRKFFEKNRTVTFYAVCGGEFPYAEKRTFEITHCVLTDVSQWNYTAAPYIYEDDELAEFIAECGRRSLYETDTDALPEQMIILSTCSYHIKGKNGRILLIGRIVSTVEDSVIEGL